MKYLCLAVLIACVGSILSDKIAGAGAQTFQPITGACNDYFCEKFNKPLCGIRYWNRRVDSRTFRSICDLNRFNCINPDATYYDLTPEDITCESIGLVITRPNIYPRPPPNTVPL